MGRRRVGVRIVPKLVDVPLSLGGQVVKNRFVFSLAVGLIMATLLSIFVVLSGLWRTRSTTEAFGLSLRSIVLTYYAAGILGGALVGLVLRLGDNWRTRTVACILGSFAFYGCVAVAMEGSVLRWDRGQWQMVIAISVLAGAAFAFMTRNDFRS